MALVQEPSAVAREGLGMQRKLRVGVFTESYPPVVNGVTTSVMTLINELEREGHEVFVFTSEFPGHSGEPDNVVRVPAVFTPFDRAYPIPLPVTRRIMKGFAAMKLDVIHSQSPFLMGVLALHIARRSGIPLIATNHTLYTDYTHYVAFAPASLVTMAAHIWIGWYYTSCDAVITPSSYSASRLRSEYDVPERQIAVVPSGIPVPAPIPADEKTAVRERYGIPPDAPLLVYAGRLAREKNLRVLLKACEEVIFPARPDARLLLAGAGMDANALQGIVKASPVLKERVTLTGFLPRQALDPIYAAATLLTFPSCTETQGMVLGEALAVGTPCIVVNEGGAPETVADGDDGIRVANDAQAMGEAVVSLLNDPHRLAAMSRAALANADTRTPQRMAAAVLALYHRAAAKSRVP